MVGVDCTSSFSPECTPKNTVFTLSTPTSIWVFSILFSIKFTKVLTRGICLTIMTHTSFSLVADHFLYSHNLNM